MLLWSKNVPVLKNDTHLFCFSPKLNLQGLSVIFQNILELFGTYFTNYIHMLNRKNFYEWTKTVKIRF